jgi:radical SAM superfamily enzyme YgiQ (UPF0313 family)
MKTCLVPTIPLPFYSPEPYLPLGLLALMAFVKTNRSYDVEIADIGLELLKGNILGGTSFYTSAAAFLASHDAKIYGFTTKAGSYIHTLTIAKYLKKLSPECIVLLGGPQASRTDLITLRAFDFVDMIIRGEGEIAFVNLLDQLHINGPLKVVRSLTYRDEKGEIHRNENEALIEDLDDLPLPSYDNYSWLLNSKYSANKPEDDIQSYIPLDSGRGCTFHCAFCYSKIQWRGQYRCKSAGRLVQEMLYLRDQYRVTTLFLAEDTFANNKRRAEEFCDLLIEKRVNIKWCCYSHVNCVNEQLLEKMSQAGCFHIYYGLESGNNHRLESINKKQTVKQSLEVIRLTLQKNIKVTASLIVGYPNESIDEINETLDLFIECIKIGAVAKIHVLGVLYETDIFRDNQTILKLNPVLDDTGFCEKNLISNEQISMIRTYPEIFTYYYLLRTPLTCENLFKKYRLEFVFPIFIQSISCLRNKLTPYNLLLELDVWAKENGTNQHNEWAEDLQLCIKEFAKFLKITAHNHTASIETNPIIDIETERFTICLKAPYQVSKTATTQGKVKWKDVVKDI